MAIAFREFASTALTKSFIIGGFVVPVAITAIMAVALPALINKEAPKVTGEVAVIDLSGAVAEDIADRLSPESLAAERQETAERTQEAISKMSEEFGAAVPGNIPLGVGTPSTEGLPTLSVLPLDVGTDPEEAKAPLRTSRANDGDRLALAVINQHAVTPDGEGNYGGFELFVSPKLDDRVQRVIRRAVRDSVRDSRIVGAGWTTEQINALTEVESPATKEVTDSGERKSSGDLDFMIPFFAMILMLMGVMVGGQYLLTTTIEEKSSRVVEVLLSAVSPMQLMTGKIIGQLMVGAMILIVYSSAAMSGLFAFAMLDLIEPTLLIWMFAFFVVAYFQIASMMAAVGSAVNDLREAQALMTPVMVVVMLPYLLGIAVAFSPNSTFAVVTSFIPPVNSFMMLIRLASTQPPPAWQALLSLLVGVVETFVFLWGAAKIFRIGLLMYGKPPSFGTLIKWIRMG